MRRLEIPFRLRGHAGRVSVEYGPNDDPRRWGCHLLDLSYRAELAEGFPVCRASVQYVGEGYAAAMGWIQIVRYRAGEAEAETVLVDVAPQLSGAGSPYYAWGQSCAFFDAPSTTEREMRWGAHTFLTASPEAVMSPTVGCVCGFRWGYETREGRPEVLPLNLTGLPAWAWACSVLSARYPSWEFVPARAA